MDRGNVFDRPVAMMRRRRYALLVTVIALQTLLWASVFVAASTAFLFIGEDIDASLLVPEILLLASVSGLPFFPPFLSSAVQLFFLLSHCSSLLMFL